MSPAKENVKEKNQLVTIAAHSTLGMGGRVFFLFVRFLSTLLVTRFLGPGEYGIFVLAMGIAAYVEVVALLGFESAMIKFIAHHLAQRNVRMARGTLVFGIKISMLAGLVLAGIGILSSDLVSNQVFHKSHLAPALRIMLVGVPFASLLAILLAALQGAKLLQYNIQIQFVTMPLCRLVANVVVLLLGFGIAGVAWVWALAPAIGIVIASHYISGNIGFCLDDKVQVDKRGLFSFSVPLLFSQMLYRNISGFEILIIGMFLPAEQLGVYGVVLRIVPILLIPFVSMNSIFAPVISDLVARQKREELESTFKTVNKWVLIMSLPLFALVAMFSTEAMAIFGRGFGESANVVLIVMIGQLFNVCTGSTGLMLSMTGKPVFNLYNNLGLFVVNVIMTLLLVPSFGLVGAAIAYSSSIVLIQFLQVGEIWYFYKIHPYRLDNVKSVISCLAATALIYLSKTIHNPQNLLSVLILSAVFLFGYGSLLFLLGFSTDDRLVVEKIRNRIFGLRQSSAQG